jgi:hypothetical protein
MVEFRAPNHVDDDDDDDDDDDVMEANRDRDDVLNIANAYRCASVRYDVLRNNCGLMM